MNKEEVSIKVDDALVGRLIDTVEDYLYDALGDYLYEKYGEDNPQKYIKGTDYDRLAANFRTALGLDDLKQVQVPEKLAKQRRNKKKPDRYSNIRFLDRGIAIGGVRKFDIVTINLSYSSDTLSLLADNLNTWTNEIVRDLGIENWDDQYNGVNFLDPFRTPSLDYYFPKNMENEQILEIIKLLTEKFNENYE